MLFFRNDYGNGAHPVVLDALCRTNLELTTGYGTDPYCIKATELIRTVCKNRDADVHFIPGGTQTNKIAIGAFLRPWQAVISADSGHINVHESGAIEHNGHRIFTVPAQNGKICPDQIDSLCLAFKNEETSPEPKLVYISNTTELGTVYSKAELRALRAVCDKWGLYLYCDGARLAAAMAVSDADFADYAAFCDAFTIGGTKNGLMFGEALVITASELMPSFRRCLKQQGAMLAKGRLLGVQYCAVLENGLYTELGAQAAEKAALLTLGLKKLGVPMFIESPSNQLFPIFTKDVIAELEKSVSFEHWCSVDETRNCVRFVTAWHTTKADVEALLALLGELIS